MGKVTVPITQISELVDGFPLLSEQHSSIPYSLAESWNNHVMPFLMNKFRPSFQMARSTYSTVLDSLSKAEKGSALYQACIAVGSAYMVNIIRSPKTTVDRAKAYGNALTVIYSAIMDPQQCRTDGTLLAVWLLGLYEVILDERSHCIVSTLLTLTLSSC